MHLSKNDLILKESVNIFTDTSMKNYFLKSQNRNISIESMGMLVTYKNLIPFQSIKVLVNEHNVVGEIKAIELAVMWCITHNNPNFIYYYNIFTDSLISVQIINGLMYKYLDKSIENFDYPVDVFFNESKKQMKTNFASIAKIIAYLILNNRVPIRIFYVPAHTDLEKNVEGEIKKSISKFKHENKFIENEYITEEEMYSLLSGNHAIDYFTRGYLLNNYNNIVNDILRTESYIDYSILRQVPLIWPYSFINNEYFLNPLYLNNNLNFEDTYFSPLYSLPFLEIK